MMIQINLAREAQKPMVIFVNTGDPTAVWRVEAVLKAQDKCREARIPVYPNIRRASKALAHFTNYHGRTNRYFRHDKNNFR